MKKYIYNFVWSQNTHTQHGNFILLHISATILSSGWLNHLHTSDFFCQAPKYKQATLIVCVSEYPILQTNCGTKLIILPPMNVPHFIVRLLSKNVISKLVILAFNEFERKHKIYDGVTLFNSYQQRGHENLDYSFFFFFQWIRKKTQTLMVGDSLDLLFVCSLALNIQSFLLLLREGRKYALRCLSQQMSDQNKENYEKILELLSELPFK